MYACVFVLCWTHLLKTYLVLSLAVCILTVSIPMQARSHTMNTVGIARYSMGAYTLFRYIYIMLHILLLHVIPRGCRQVTEVHHLQPADMLTVELPARCSK